ncbi:DNA helicase-like protein [Bacillus phage Mgbh1]|uniref:DNA helicase-like protein n=1 Tax=Bacillus phage Mgbh1 TaxID=1796993 RepID=A0A142F1Q0_9CAUD|nr:DNA helicase-like protein [Bacillus phage Mgbh1]AMQ66707.1 DNA helicase-like protein [Bacillus phage Mgbh1]
MSGYGSMFLSKVIDTENFNAFSKHNITENSFISDKEKEVYRFIQEYHERNRGKTPSYATVTSEFPDFFYVPGVTDSFSYIANKIRQQRAELDFKVLVEKELPGLYEDVGRHDMTKFTELLTSRMEEIKIGLRTGVRVGLDLKANATEYLEEYERRKEGKSFKMYPSSFPVINRALGGGYIGGNMYVTFGKTGRGKTAVTLYEAVFLAVNGATVLIWSMEMATYEVLTRILSFVSAMSSVSQASINGQKFGSGFDTSKLRSGQLDGEYEEKLRQMLENINDHIKGNIVLRAVDDPDFDRRNLAQLQADIEEVKADVVMVDPFYYLDYERNTSRKTGGDAEETSKKLRRIAGRTGTVVFAITQAEEDKSEGKRSKKGDEVIDGLQDREIKLPVRGEVKKTTQLLEDAALCIGVDTNHKKKLGRIGLAKGRDGGEDEVAEIIYVPEIGIIQELVIDSSMFDI